MSDRKALHERLSLRQRVFLIFAGLGLGILALIAVGLYAAAQKMAAANLGFLGQRAPGLTSALTLAGLIGGLGGLGLVTWVWYLFDQNVARPIETLAGGLRAGAAPLGAEGKYLADLAPATRDACGIGGRPAQAALAEGAVLQEILADPGAGLILSDLHGHVILFNAAAEAALPGLAIGQDCPDCPAARRRELSIGHLDILPAPAPSDPHLQVELSAISALALGGLQGGHFVVFDTETTGLDPETDRIVQIAGVRLRGGRDTGERFETLVNPGRSIPPKSSAIHGISDKMVRDAPDMTGALTAFRDFCEGATLIAHNAPFDMGLLHAAEEETGQRFDQPVMDTILLSAMLWGQAAPHSLDALVARLGIDLPPEKRHTAMGDAEATAQAALRLLMALAGKGIRSFDEVRAEAKKHRRLLADANRD